MRSFIIASAGVFASATATFDLDAPGVSVASKWGAWKQRFAPHGADEAAGFAKFAATEARIVAHNARGLPWTLGHNQFSDLAPDEFEALYIARSGLNPHAARPVTRVVNATELPAPPASVDWVAKGALPAVKNQAQCGSCWAFSTVGAVEGAFEIAGNPLTTLSEQELVSCATSSGNQGCNGGLMDNAFKWIETNGLPTEQAYPYTSGTGTTGACVTGKTPVVTVTGYTDVAKNDEDALVAAAALTPVSIAIEADKSAFQSYKSGILDNPACGTQLDHGVIVAGYGTDGGVDYYKVRNSWGGTWGEAGYIRMVRGKNQCGISLSASYPTGVKAMGPISPTPPPAPTPVPPTPPPTPAPPPLPPVKPSFCADLVETLTIDGSPPTVGRQYTLCVDVTNLRWSQRYADDSSFDVFNGTDIFRLAKSAAAPGGFTCTTKTTGPEQPSFMPYSITNLDVGTTLNKTETYDNIPGCSDYWHFRQGHPPQRPNENMHWHLGPVDGKASPLLATDCIQRSGTDRKGPLQHGVRDMSKNYGPFDVAKSALPADVVCTAMPPAPAPAVVRGAWTLADPSFE